MKSCKNDFPIFTRRSSKFVYLDSAATSQKPQIVLDALREYYEEYNANIHRGLYQIAERATAKVEEVRRKVAKFINSSSPEEIIFTYGTTSGINLLMYAWGVENIRKGDSIIATVMEHHSNFVPWQQLAKEKQANFVVLDISDEGEIDVENLAKKAKNAKLFAITYVSNMLGTVNPLKKIIAEVRKFNPEIIVLVDAAQAIPHMQVDVVDLDCDFLVFSGHKMLAETGIGVLYGRKELLEKMQPFFYGGDMIREVKIETSTFADIPTKFEAGTINIGGIVSLGAAIDFLSRIGMGNIKNYEQSLTDYCLKKMKSIDGIRIYGPSAKKRCGVISFTIDGIHAHDVAQILSDEGICVRSGHHCTMPLHKRLGIQASTRASFYMYNDESDIDAFVEVLEKIKTIFA